MKYERAGQVWTVPKPGPYSMSPRPDMSWDETDIVRPKPHFGNESNFDLDERASLHKYKFKYPPNLGFYVGQAMWAWAP